MERLTKEDVLRLVEEDDVEFIRLQFTDMFGTMKNIAITSRELPKALNNECIIDGSYIDGCGRGGSDRYVSPSGSEYVCHIPWRPQQGKVARLLCDILSAGSEDHIPSVHGMCWIGYQKKQRILDIRFWLIRNVNSFCSIWMMKGCRRQSPMKKQAIWI